MKLSKREAAYFSKKKLGGAVNQQGNTYEKYFTVNEIVVHTNKYLTQLQDLFISTQINAFVDDLYIFNEIIPEKTFYQLKSGRTLSWESVKKFKSLAFDFNKQRVNETSSGNAFSLQLIVADAKIKRDMEVNLPQTLKSCTKVRLFPYHPSINQQLKNDPDFRKEIEALCAFPDLDKLEALAALILGKWEASTKANICLLDLFNSLRVTAGSYIKPTVPPSLTPSFKNILNAIPDFSFKEVGGHLEWAYRTTFSGKMPAPIDSAEFRNIEQSVISNHPTDFSSLHPLIS